MTDRISLTDNLYIQICWHRHQCDFALASTPSRGQTIAEW